MNKKLLIIGASGHGKVVADIATKMNCYEEISFLDDREEVKNCMQFSVVGKVKDVYNYLEEADIFVAIGNPEVRERMINDLKNNNAIVPTLIHPNSVIGENVLIGKGTVIMAGAIINPDTKVGEGCIINTSASVDHDCNLGDYTHVSVDAHLAGTVTLGKGTWVGVGASIINNISVCDNVMIGAGAVVVKDILESGTYVGVPARKMIK